MHAPIAVLATFGFLVSCGSSPARKPKVFSPEVTPAGTAVGTAVPALVGPAGGTVASADGRLTLIVPAGALGSETTLTVQPITPTAPGGVRAWRLEPEGQTFLLPIALVIAYRDDDVAGSAAEALEVGFQNANGTWSALKKFTVDAAARTLTAQTTHFSDWSLLQGLQLRPLDPTVSLLETVTLIVNNCERIDEGPDSEVVNFLAKCEPDDLVLRTGEWKVNEVLGGNGTLGTITAQGLGAAVFGAPAVKPTPSRVTVSTEFTRDVPTKDKQGHEIPKADQHGARGLLISNITIVGVAGWSGTVTYAASGTKTTDESGQSGIDTTWTKRTVKTVNGMGVIQLTPGGFPGALTISSGVGNWSETSVAVTDAVNHLTTCGYVSKSTVESSLSGVSTNPPSALGFVQLIVSGNAYQIIVPALLGEMTGTLHTFSPAVPSSGMSCTAIAAVDLTSDITGQIPYDSFLLEGAIDPAKTAMIVGAKTFAFGTDPVRTYEVSWVFQQ